MASGGKGSVREWFDDETGRRRMEANVGNDRFGPLFGYSGSFTVELRDTSGSGVSLSVKPGREERRG